jgi:ribosomal protein S18 acetylase RimI-like enzyme
MIHRHVLTQIEANMRAVGRQGRRVIGLAGFEIFISPGQLDHLTFAVPLPAEPIHWARAIADMQAIFAQHDKRPRLEYIVDLHPELGLALEEAGLVCESRAPVLVLDTADLAPPPLQTPPAYYRQLTADNDPLLSAYLINQSIAYGGFGGQDALDWLPNLQYGLANGGLMGAVLEQAGEMVSGATIQIGGGIGELAGVWSAPQWRSRGLAFALCQQLLADYTAVGYTHCWLSAAAGAQRLYEKLGFVYVGMQLNYGRPAAVEAGSVIGYQ